MYMRACAGAGLFACAYSSRVETFKTILRFATLLQRPWVKIARKPQPLNLPQSQTKCLPPQQNKATEKRISNTKAETWKVTWRGIGGNCKEPVPSNPRVAEATEKLVEINCLCHGQCAICCMHSLERHQPAIASSSPAAAELSLFSNEMQFNQPSPSMLNLWTTNATVSLEKESVVLL